MRVRLLKADEIRFNYPREEAAEEVHSEIREGELSLFFMSHQDIVASDLISHRLRAVICTEWSL